MKAIFFTIAVLFSFATMNAQNVAAVETNATINVKASKTDFYKALVKANNFDITIKEDKKEVTNTTKKEFYNLILEKNGFKVDTKKNTRLTHNAIDAKNTVNTQSNPIVSLIP